MARGRKSPFSTEQLAYIESFLPALNQVDSDEIPTWKNTTTDTVFENLKGALPHIADKTDDGSSKIWKAVCAFTVK
jgi:hypothetical protein